MRDEIERLDILRVFEFLGGEMPGHIKTHGWTEVRCLVHGGVSGSINPSIQKIWCFGCDFHGDAYDLLQEVGGYSLAESRDLAEQNGWAVSSDGRVPRGPARRPYASARRPERAERGRKPERRG